MCNKEQEQNGTALNTPYIYYFANRVDYFVLGWALKENQVYGKKGGGKQISDKSQRISTNIFSFRKYG